MVDMRASNAKLRRRAEAIVREIVRCPASDAARCVVEADGDVKTAVLLALGVARSEAAQLLRRHEGNLRKSMDEARSLALSPARGAEPAPDGARAPIRGRGGGAAND
jgi:N-acetylmuramic acid 6-phosphate etherase